MMALILKIIAMLVFWVVFWILIDFQGELKEEFFWQTILRLVIVVMVVLYPELLDYLGSLEVVI